MNALVVINPRSGGGKGAVIGAQVREHFGTSSDQVTYIEAPSLAESLLQVEHAATSAHFDCLICVGGDGLVHDLLPTLLKHSLPLLVIPAGTGNDFARTLGLQGKRISKLLALPTKGEISVIDMGIVSHSGFETPFVQILSTGFDAIVNERANNFKHVRGKIKYVLAVLQKVWRYRAIDFDITIDGASQSRRAMMVCIANGTSYGGGMQIAPHAKNNDGYLDLMIVDDVSPLRLLMVFPRVFFGTHVNHPKVHFLTGREILISARSMAFADGEPIAELPVRVGISGKSLQVFRL